MKLSDFAIDSLKAIIVGDDPATTYLGGPQLTALFNTFGLRDIYEFGNGGFPKDEATDRHMSRKEYAKNRMHILNNSKSLKDLLERVCNSAPDAGKAAEIINKIISQEGFILEKVDSLYLIKGAPAYDVATAPDVHFEEIQGQILNEINQARYTIWVAVAWFTDKTLFDALVEKRNNGLNIQVIIVDDDINRASGLKFEEYFETRRISKTYFDNIMHHKFCVIDFETVINGSYNWSKRAQYNHENITIDKNRKTVDGFADQFMKLKLT